MQDPEPFVDIHCHLLSGIDDGSKSWDETLAMARMAVVDGIGTIIVTPHQLGGYGHNGGVTIRDRTAELGRFLQERDIPLSVLAGADVRIEDDMIARLRSGDVVTLADKRKHVLLELPHELYFPLEQLLDELNKLGMTGILSHPERNEGLLQQPKLLGPLVQQGCLMQITAGSLLGTFGSRCRLFAERMLQQGLVHFVATDAHSSEARRPLIHRAFERVVELTNWDMAADLCCRYPAQVAAGQDIVMRPRKTKNRRRRSWFRFKTAG